MRNSGLKNTIGLKSNYINILEEDGSLSFGGSQDWVVKDSESKRSKNNIIRAFGCGLISAVDILAYIEKTEKQSELNGFHGHPEGEECTDECMTLEEYRERINQFERIHFHVSYWLGIPGTRLARKMNRFFRRKKLPYRAKWGMSGKKLLTRLKEMLAADIPATLGIGPGFFKKDRLGLYVMKLDKEGQFESGNLKYSLKRKGTTKDHYVTVTGIVEDEERTLLEISSWGRKYYIDFNEYTDYVKKCDNYIFSNILYIRRLENK